MGHRGDALTPACEQSDLFNLWRCLSMRSSASLALLSACSVAVSFLRPLRVHRLLVVGARFWTTGEWWSNRDLHRCSAVGRGHDCAVGLWRHVSRHVCWPSHRPGPRGRQPVWVVDRSCGGFLSLHRQRRRPQLDEILQRLNRIEPQQPRYLAWLLNALQLVLWKLIDWTAARLLMNAPTESVSWNLTGYGRPDLPTCVQARAVAAVAASFMAPSRICFSLHLRPAGLWVHVASGECA